MTESEQRQAGTESADDHITPEMVKAAAHALAVSGWVRWNAPDWATEGLARNMLEAAFDARQEGYSGDKEGKHSG